MIRLYRDLTYDGGGDYAPTITEEEAKEAVLKVYPKAFIKKWRGSNGNFNSYQVVIPKRIFFTQGIGGFHFWEDQAWISAYSQLQREGLIK